jgi:hypothetical protein
MRNPVYLAGRWGFQTTSILGYRKMGQNAIYIELAYEGMAMNPDGSFIYKFLSRERLNLRALMTDGAYFI